MMISRNAHLKMAAALWGFVGSSLLLAGLFFLFGRKPVPEGLDSHSIISFIVGFGLGVIKWRFAITRVSQKNIARILALPERPPLYMTFSAKSWVFVIMMILLGRLIRLAGAPSFIVGGIYVAVGTALLLGSRGYLKKTGSSPK